MAVVVTVMTQTQYSALRDNVDSMQEYCQSVTSSLR